MRKYGKVSRFLLYSLSLCLGWFLLYDFWLSHLDELLTLKVVNSTVHLLNLAGYNAVATGIMVQIDGKDTVFVYHACNGMVLKALFAGFVLAFPGPFLKKLVFIPAGIAAIYLINVLRVSALALNAHHFHQSLNFNHKYTFTVLVYAAIFALWMIWVKRYSGLKDHAATKKQEVQPV